MGVTSATLGTPMLARDQRTPFSEWWWTVDKLLLAAISALMLAGVILSLAAGPPVATRIGLDPFHFFSRPVMFLLPPHVLFPAAVFRGVDGGVFHVAEGDPPLGAAGVRGVRSLDRGDAGDRA